MLRLRRLHGLCRLGTVTAFTMVWYLAGQHWRAVLLTPVAMFVALLLLWRALAGGSSARTRQ